MANRHEPENIHKVFHETWQISVTSSKSHRTVSAIIEWMKFTIAFELYILKIQISRLTAICESTYRYDRICRSNSTFRTPVCTIFEPNETVHIKSGIIIQHQTIVISFGTVNEEIDTANGSTIAHLDIVTTCFISQ